MFEPLYEPHPFGFNCALIGIAKDYVIARENTNPFLAMAAAQSATGDLKNNLMKLLREIQRMKLRVEPNIQG